MTLHDIRTDFAAYLQLKVPNETVAMDYLPEGNSQGGVSFIITSFTSETGTAGMPLYRRATVDVFVDKLTRQACDTVVEAITTVGFRESSGCILHISATGFSDYLRDPNDDRFFSSRVTFLLQLG